MKKMTKQLRQGKLEAESTLGTLCYEIIKYAKERDGKRALETYNMLIGASMVYSDFDVIEEDVTPFGFAKRFLENECEEQGEDYYEIIHFVLAQ